ncbi:MAG: ribonuclease H-like domain-containing protein [Candidatus Nanohalobium sp.]
MAELVIDIETTGLEPDENHIICIGVRDLQRKRTYCFENSDEEDMLELFFSFIEARRPERWIAYNTTFDRRFIFVRAAKYDLDCKGFFSITYEDLMPILTNGGYCYSSNEPKGLGEWAEFFLGEGKMMDNGSVPEKYEKGKIQEIKDYCRTMYKLQLKSGGKSTQ